jgi:hypothetical protein
MVCLTHPGISFRDTNRTMLNRGSPQRDLSVSTNNVAAVSKGHHHFGETGKNISSSTNTYVQLP